jgi:hypothetical protein
MRPKFRVETCANPRASTGVNPFPGGIGGPINSILQDAAMSIDGITNIAGDANGNWIAEPLDLGYFPKWANQ